MRYLSLFVLALFSLCLTLVPHIAHAQQVDCLVYECWESNDIDIPDIDDLRDDNYICQYGSQHGVHCEYYDIPGCPPECDFKICFVSHRPYKKHTWHCTDDGFRKKCPNGEWPRNVIALSSGSQTGVLTERLSYIPFPGLGIDRAVFCGKPYVCTTCALPPGFMDEMQAIADAWRDNQEVDIGRKFRFKCVEGQCEKENV